MNPPKSFMTQVKSHLFWKFQFSCILQGSLLFILELKGRERRRDNRHDYLGAGACLISNHHTSAQWLYRQWAGGGYKLEKLPNPSHLISHLSQNSLCHVLSSIPIRCAIPLRQLTACSGSSWHSKTQIKVHSARKLSFHLNLLSLGLYSFRT
jgi:hypothetical protein